jgi:uncharacterized membrane protein
MYNELFKNIYILLGVIVLIFIVRELLKYIISTWITFCVFYTLSDLYRKRRVFLKYTKFIKIYGKSYFPEYFVQIPKRKYIKIN